MSISFVTGLTTPSLTFAGDPRATRIAHEHRALSQSVANFAFTTPSISPLGPDPVVQQILLARGFARTDFVVLHVGLNSKLVTAIVVPTRIWRDPETKREVLEAKREALEVRSRCLVVPQRWIRGSVRAHVARVLAQSRTVHFRPQQSAALLEYVAARRFCTLRECSELLEHDDPYAVVLSLCARGELRIDRSAPITPSSIVAI